MRCASKLPVPPALREAGRLVSLWMMTTRVAVLRPRKDARTCGSSVCGLAEVVSYTWAMTRVVRNSIMHILTGNGPSSVMYILSFALVAAVFWDVYKGSRIIVTAVPPPRSSRRPDWAPRGPSRSRAMPRCWSAHLPSRRLFNRLARVGRLEALHRCLRVQGVPDQGRLRRSCRRRLRPKQLVCVAPPRRGPRIGRLAGGCQDALRDIANPSPCFEGLAAKSRSITEGGCFSGLRGRNRDPPPAIQDAQAAVPCWNAPEGRPLRDQEGHRAGGASRGALRRSGAGRSRFRNGREDPSREGLFF